MNKPIEMKPTQVFDIAGKSVTTKIPLMIARETIAPDIELPKDQVFGDTSINRLVEANTLYGYIENGIFQIESYGYSFTPPKSLIDSEN